MEIGVVKNVNKTIAKSFGNYIAGPTVGAPQTYVPQ